MVKKSQQNTQQPPMQSFVQLPLMGTVAIYVRIAAPDQLTPTTKPKPVDHLKSFALELGFQEDRIIMFEDNGISGSIPLAERGSNLLTAIAQGAIQVVLVADESRLFHDADAYQVSYFIHLCKEKGVIVITPHIVYDFQNAQLIRIFRMQCEQAFLLISQLTNSLQTGRKVRHERTK